MTEPIAFQLSDSRYPDRLRMLTNPPPSLWLKGRWDDTKVSVGIVGARACTKESELLAKSLAKDLAQLDIAVVSGGAMGIDTAAHEGALEGGGRTCAVLGTGIDVIYPLRNKNLFERIVSKDGCLLSCFSPKAPFEKWHFPARNHLIAALCDVVVLIQAPLLSGSRYTATAAKRLGKPVVVFAGQPEVFDLLSQGALSVCKSADVIRIVAQQTQRTDLLQYETDKPPVETNPASDLCLSTEAKIMLQHITKSPSDMGELSAQTNISVATAASALIELELSGLCMRLPGQRYVALW